VSVVLISGFVFVVEILPICRVFEYYILWMYLWVDDMATWGVCYISIVMFYCWDFYAYQLRFIWRRDVYFLNIYYIRVFYRFNISRALQPPCRSEPPRRRRWSWAALFMFFFQKILWESYREVRAIFGLKRGRGRMKWIKPDSTHFISKNEPVWFTWAGLFHFGSLLFFLNHQISPSFNQTVMFYSLLNLVYVSSLHNCETPGLSRWI